MANFENIASAAVEWVDYNDLAQRVRSALIAGSTPSTLDEIQKTAKGSFLFAKSFDSSCGRYRLYVGKGFNGAGKVAYLYDNQEKKLYQTKAAELKDFSAKIDEMVSREKAYPTRK